MITGRLAPRLKGGIKSIVQSIAYELSEDDFHPIVDDEVEPPTIQLITYTVNKSPTAHGFRESGSTDEVR
jgi:hypothetical protein